MNLRKITNSDGKPMYLLIDDKGIVNQAALSYIKSLGSRKYSPNTMETNAYHLKIFFTWLELKGLTYLDIIQDPSPTHKGAFEYLSDYKLWLEYPDYNDKITPINGYKAARKISSINQMIDCVTNFYSYLVSIQAITNVAVFQQTMTTKSSHSYLNELFIKKEKRVKNLLISKDNSEKSIRYVTKEQYLKLRDLCISRRNRIIIGLAFEGALRRSEIIALNLTDLRDIHKNIVYVSHHYDPNNMTFLKYNSEGITIISDALRDDIIAYITEDLIDIDTNYLLVNFKKGKDQYKPMTASGVNTMISTLEKRADMEGLHIHAFRHGCAMNMLRAGRPMNEIQDKLRHKHIETTIETYAKYDTEDKEKNQEEYLNDIEMDCNRNGINLEQLLNTMIEGEDANE